MQKRIFFRIAAILCALEILQGCSSFTFYMRQNRWVGSDVSKILKEYGEPTKQEATSEGKTLYIYENFRKASGKCTVTWVINRKNIVESWDSEGSGCIDEQWFHI